MSSAPHSLTVKYLVAELQVERENHRDFCDKMKGMVGLMFENYGWELVQAAYPISGENDRFVHIWKIPDESSVLRVMRDGAPFDLSARGRSKKKKSEKDFFDKYDEIQKLIVSTRHSFMTSLPHDPEAVGIQSQTILIDAEGEPFIINHAKLGQRRNHAEQLESVRTKIKQGIAGQLTGDDEMFARMQIHLDEGATSSWLKRGKSDVLFFNLAALKPRSVFQEVELPLPEERSKEIAFPQGDGDADVPSALFVATPWGGVYELTPENVGEIAVPITGPAKEKTDHRLTPLVEGRIPLASIPETRDALVGDGCMCYVINLSSFTHSRAHRTAIRARWKV